MLPLCVIFGTKLGGVLLFRVSFEKGVWLLVSRLGGWLMAQQQRLFWCREVLLGSGGSSSNSSIISGRQHQHRHQRTTAPAPAAARFSGIYSLRFSKMQLLQQQQQQQQLLQQQQEQQEQQSSRTEEQQAQPWCFPVRDLRFCSSQQAASTIYSLGFSRIYPRIL